MEKVFNGRLSFSQISNNEDDNKLKFNFEIVVSKNCYVGSYTFDNEIDNEKEILEFYNNDLNKTFRKLQDSKKTYFKNKIYKYIESTKPDVWVEISEKLYKSDDKELPNLTLTMEKEDLEPLCDSVSPNPDKNKDEVCLNSIFNKINKEYFNGEMKAKIIWSKNVPLKKRRSIMLGSFDEENNIIKISPCLKKDFVPIYFIESVVYHEMLHSIHAVKRVRGRNQIHGSSFKKDEKKFEHYKKSKKWLKENLAKLLSD